LRSSKGKYFANISRGKFADGAMTFQVQKDVDRDISFQVRIYTTRKKMIDGVNNYCKYLDVQNDCEYTATMIGACIHTPPVPTKRGTFYPGMFCTVFLNLEYITPEVVTHEALHAAFAHERYVNRYTGEFDSSPCEERIASCLEDIREGMWKAVQFTKASKKNKRK
jgi:hypothetical protein